MWKFQDFSATQILREINVGHFEAPKTAILTIWAALNFEFVDIFDIFKREIAKKSKIRAAQMVKMAVFWASKSPKLFSR